MIYGFSAMWVMIHFTQWVTRYFHIVQSFSTVSSHVANVFLQYWLTHGRGYFVFIDQPGMDQRKDIVNDHSDRDNSWISYCR